MRWPFSKVPSDRWNSTRAYHLKKAYLLGLSNDRDGEARELGSAQVARSETALDFFLSGQQEYKRHKYPDAIQDFESALQKKSSHFWAKCLMGICDIQTGQFPAAKARLDDCITTDPEFAWLYLLRGFASSTFAARQSDAGRKSMAEFEFNLAEADFTQALERLKLAPDQELQYVLLVNRGVNRFQRKRFDQAAADYNEAIRTRKDSSVALAGLGHVYQKEGKFAEAIEQYNRAIAIKPDWAPLYRERAKLRRSRSDATPADRAAALDDIKLAIQHEKIDNSVLAVDHTSRESFSTRTNDSTRRSKRVSSPWRLSPVMSMLRSSRSEFCSN